MSKHQAFKLSFKHGLVAAVTVSGALLASTAQAAGPIGIYAGGNYGLGATMRSCNGFGASIDTCERIHTGGKLFGGYRATPNVAVELNYFYFGGVNKKRALVGGAPGSNDYESWKESARAYTAGINWEVELFSWAVQNIRVGWAWTQNNKSQELTAGIPAVTTHSFTRTYGQAPYVGVGLGFPINEYVRFNTGADFILHGSKSRMLFSAGLSGDF